MRRIKSPYFALAAIFFVEVAIYATNGGAFVLDDNPSILNNPALLGSLPQAVSTSPFRAVTVIVNWANLQITTFDATGFHLVNLTLHLAAALLLFFLIREFSDTGKSSAAAIIGAGWVALNPLTNFAMLYISARSTMLATVWTLAAILAYLHYERKGNPIYLALASLSSVLAMLSKENGVAAPILIMVLSILGAGERRRRIVAAIWALVLLGLFVFLRLGHLIYLGPESSTPGVYHYFLTQMTVIPRYLLKLIWPIGLSLEQDAILRTHLDTAVLAGATGMAAVWGGLIWRFRRSKTVVFFLIWLPITFAPESSIIPFADVAFLHRVYMPATGIAALIAYAMSGLLQRASATWQKNTAVAMTGGVFLLFALAGFAPAMDWRSNIAVHRQSVRVSPNKFRARYDMGVALNNNLQYYLALPHLEEAVRIGAPSTQERAWVLNALGKARFRRGDFDGALACFFQATLDAPEWDDPFMNAGLTLLIIGDPQRALVHLNRARALGNSSQQVLDAIKRAQEALGGAGPTNQKPGTVSP